MAALPRGFEECTGLIELKNFNNPTLFLANWFDIVGLVYDILIYEEESATGQTTRRRATYNSYDLEIMSRSYLYEVSASFMASLQYGDSSRLNMPNCVLEPPQILANTSFNLDIFETPKANKYIRDMRSL
jgi:hypothetical protein